MIPTHRLQTFPCRPPIHFKNYPPQKKQCDDCLENKPYVFIIEQTFHKKLTQLFNKFFFRLKPLKNQFVFDIFLIIKFLLLPLFF